MVEYINRSSFGDNVFQFHVVSQKSGRSPEIEQKNNCKQIMQKSKKCLGSEIDLKMIFQFLALFLHFSVVFAATAISPKQGIWVHPDSGDIITTDHVKATFTDKSIGPSNWRVFNNKGLDGKPLYVFQGQGSVGKQLWEHNVGLGRSGQTMRVIASFEARKIKTAKGIITTHIPSFRGVIAHPPGLGNGFVRTVFFGHDGKQIWSPAYPPGTKSIPPIPKLTLPKEYMIPKPAASPAAPIKNLATEIKTQYTAQSRGSIKLVNKGNANFESAAKSLLPAAESRAASIASAGLRAIKV